ncbi:uncharacterized protein ASCRUDRAFT_77939 [Ascoidea rubescens DSM 1968]|uniref:Uncharacterized protein n=1 Tax=Ascoidea rubescens DSM 1968 TaxID=1344418 RepID=A0A1D2VA34_9ASCO|nr:hypothetical protein ASCRUDRAFT_77939 [Ascoidea rubescens DSM 1968]ODV58471.1 hypothetical protein ASCRUDRAFT_77939 [Ascoidea rubescens DSM 1968]
MSENYYPFYPAPWTNIQNSNVIDKNQSSAGFFRPNPNKDSGFDSIPNIPTTLSSSTRTLANSSVSDLTRKQIAENNNKNKILFVKIQNFPYLPTSEISLYDKHNKIITWNTFLYYLKECSYPHISYLLFNKNINIYLPQKNCYILSDHWLYFVSTGIYKIIIKLKDINYIRKGFPLKIVKSKSSANNKNKIAPNSKNSVHRTSIENKSYDLPKPPKQTCHSKIIHWLMN